MTADGCTTEVDVLSAEQDDDEQILLPMTDLPSTSTPAIPTSSSAVKQYEQARQELAVENRRRSKRKLVVDQEKESDKQGDTTNTSFTETDNANGDIVSPDAGFRRKRRRKKGSSILSSEIVSLESMNGIGNGNKKPNLNASLSPVLSPGLAEENQRSIQKMDTSNCGSGIEGDSSTNRRGNRISVSENLEESAGPDTSDKDSVHDHDWDGMDYINSEEGSDADEEGRLVIRDEEKEILSLSKQFDINLEEKARACNLSAINVKTILRHLMKNPQVLSLLGIEMGSAEEDTVQIRLTRGKAKELMDTGKLTMGALPMKDPVIPTRTFLDVEYSNEDEDEDYDPTKEPEVEPEEEWRFPSVPTTPNSLSRDSATPTPSSPASSHKSEETTPMMGPPKSRRVPRIPKPPDIPCLHTRSKESLAEVPIESFEKRLERADPDFTKDIASESVTSLDPNYLDFLCGLTFDDPTAINDTREEEENDPEYNYIEEAEEEGVDTDEVRSDKATKISKKEVENLLQDLFDIYNDNHEEEEGGEEELSNLPSTSSAPPPRPLPHPHPPYMDGWERRLQDPLKDTVLLTNALGPVFPAAHSYVLSLPFHQTPLVSQSSSLFQQTPVFTAEERLQLAQQLRQHTQLLLQTHLLTRTRKDLEREANLSLRMILELSEQKKIRKEERLKTEFDIFNLPWALNTINKPFDRPPTWGNVSKTLFHRKTSMSLRSMIEIAKSTAILYPDLLPLAGPSENETDTTTENKKLPWFKSEDSLLALGCEQFSTNSERLKLIHTNMLPTRTEYQIRNRLKWIARRKCPQMKNNPVWYFKEHGKAPDMSRDPLASLPCYMLLVEPHQWPTQEQPIWLRTIAAYIQRADVTDHCGLMCTYQALTVALQERSVFSGMEKTVSRRPKKQPAVTFIPPNPLSSPRLLPRPPSQVMQGIVLTHSSSASTTIPSPPTVTWTSPSRQRIALVPRSPVLLPRGSSPLKKAINYLNNAAALKAKEEQLVRDFKTGQEQTLNSKESERSKRKKPKMCLEFVSPKGQVEAERWGTERLSGLDVDQGYDSGNGTAHEEDVVGGGSGGSWATDNLAPPPASLPRPHFPTDNTQLRMEEKGEEQEQKKKKRTKQEKAKEGISALLNAHSSSLVTNGLCQAYVHDLQKALFMHESKLENLMKYILEHDNADDAVKMFPLLVSHLCSDAHPNSLLSRLLTLFLTEEQADKCKCPHTKHNYTAAWNVIAKIERYCAYAKSKGFAKAVFRGILENGGNFTSNNDSLRVYLRNTLGNDHFLWEHIKGLFPEENSQQSVPSECFERMEKESVEEMEGEEDRFETLPSLPPDFQPGGKFHPDTPCTRCPPASSKSLQLCTSCRLRFVGGSVYALHGARCFPARVFLARLKHSAEVSSYDFESGVLVNEELLAENKQVQGLLSLVDEIDREYSGTGGRESVDVVRKAMYMAFGSSRISFIESPEKYLSNSSSVFLRGEEGKATMLGGHTVACASFERTLTPPPSPSPATPPASPSPQWTPMEDRTLLEELRENVFVEDAVDSVKHKVNRTEEEIRIRYHLLVQLLEETE